MTATMQDRPGPDRAGEEALDAYSRVVTSVARTLAPSVVSLRTRGQRPGGGSAVVIAPDGFLLTSAHVVNGASGGTATLADGREMDFEVTGADALSDLAVVRVAPAADGDPLVPAVLGEADHLEVGQLVVAVGNPLGFAGSVSAGVVSGLGRSMATRAGSASRIIENVIQTDASLHPGNSGGALATAEARVVGINTAVVGPMIGQGLGLAVPINATTRRVVADLMTAGRVRRAYLGLAGGSRALSPVQGRAAGQTTGVQVTSVVAGSPAGRAGVRPGDIVARVAGVAVSGVGELQRLMTEDRVGRPLEVVLLRGEAPVSLTVVPVELA
ncbi:MAG TPA: trypsin-like peptidase domain-containing protein [Acidimicrobiales bacterium]|nr:trypsin-like peptidase domain-containing protein [Acidimicrobiales bacterium]